MALTQDFTKPFKDMMGNWPMDSDAMEGAWATSAGFGEKLSNIAFGAAGKTTDISMQWTMETLGRMGDMTKAKSDPADYAKAMSDFATAQMESATSHMTALGEVAKQMQSETLELMMSTGKDMAEDASAAAATTAKATEDAAEKATAAAKTAAPAAPAKRTTSTSTTRKTGTTAASGTS
ncbi:phasin family protein [Salipiger abyssi]|uniref:phasin family protein n=1 Tax=Salipiger abyssi TaxID=1250539 RepID=UPI001A8DB88D|nr:phasin family protein [Salipiger abyssi]MBN9887499.1 phasin family protein [Salipiger abyssi]